MSDRPLSILHFSNSAVRGGAEEHILTLLRRLDRSAFRLALACPPALAAALKSDLPADVDVFAMDVSRPRHAATAARLFARLRRGAFDVLHSHLFYSSVFASPLGWLAGVPVIVETPHCREQWREGRITASYAVDRAAGRFVDHYVAVSEANARYLVDEKGLPKRKVVVIQNGCDLTRFEPDRAAPPALRAELGIGLSDPVLMVVGRLEPQKGHAVLFDALPEVKRRFPSVQVVCLGEGALRPRLEEQVRRLGLAQTVHFLGRRSNIEEWLTLADLTVLPSFYEGLPLVALESLATGRPVVATAVDGTPEVVLDGVTGRTVPPGDPAALAAAIGELLSDPARRQAMGRRGRAWVEDRFSEARQIADTSRFYVDAWRRSPRRRRPDQRAAATVRPVQP